MAKKQEDAQAFPENYAQVRAKIIDGTVTQQELSTLYDHYSSIKEFYKENGKEIGAARNMIFHIVSTSITSFAEEASRRTGGNERNDVPKAAKVLLEEVYGRGNDPKLQPLIDQIPNKGVEKTTGSNQEQNVPSARKRGEEVVERPELVGPALKPRELQPTRKRANAMDKANAEEIGKIAKSTKPKPLEGQKQKAKHKSQDSGLVI
ncbi:MAG: hypothetical protein J0L79_06030 [Rickettsiales bacterium]|nr:hypothetical protein [Rickettsiales bacterium]MCA0254591.1 hypothetical protein [Pseudomonadota bacterium]